MKTFWLILVLLFAPTAFAFKLKPHASDAEQSIRFLSTGRFASIFDSVTARVVDHFSDAVHEEITHRIYGCEAKPENSCVTPLPWGKFAPKGVLFGVQWNDNPPFRLNDSGFSECQEPVTKQKTIRLPSFSACWIRLFKDAEDNSAKFYFDGSTGHALVYRVHFGDMQFIHAMASGDGESSRDTKEKIMAWAELMYRASLDSVPSPESLSNSTLSRIKSVFRHNGWNIGGLLTLGQGTEYRVSDVAFGSLLHMIEDSFAYGHVKRDESTSSSQCRGMTPGLGKAGDVLEFHSYERQNKEAHSSMDSRDSLSVHLLSANGPTVVDVGRVLVAMRTRSEKWEVVQPYLSQCVFNLPEELEDHRAGPGDGDLRMR